MTAIRNISIPETCNQQWQQMTKVDEGRYCNSCCKTVTDFTKMSNDEIIRYLSVNEHVCGRFEYGQTDSLNNRIAIQNAGNFSWKGLLAGLSIMSLLPSIKAEASVKNSTFQGPGTLKTSKNGIVLDTLSHCVIRGKIIGGDDSLALVDATVKIKGTQLGTMADANGNFVLNIPDSTTVLTVSYIGYVSQDVLVSKYSKSQYVITLNQPVVMKVAMMGEVVVVKSSLPRRIWYKIKRLF